MSKDFSDEGETGLSDKPIWPRTEEAHDENNISIEKSSETPLPTDSGFNSSQEPPPPPPKDDKYVEQHQPAIGRNEATKNDENSNNMPDKGKILTAGSTLGIPEDITRHAFTRNNSNMEIQNIMEQFNEGKGSLDTEELMAQRTAVTSPTFLPPRTSSLEKRGKEEQSPIVSPTKKSFNLTSPISQLSPPLAPPKQSQMPYRSSLTREDLNSVQPMSLAQPHPLPDPDPEPELPFDFHRFLEQLRHRTADPVAKFLRSFLNEFGKKQWMVHEQVKIISDFLEFISKKMAQCEVWRTVSDVEFDNAREGMEKLVMNRLYSQTFSPVIPPEAIGPGSQPKGSQLGAKPGRRGQHQEDVERDDVLAQKMRIYAWVSESHLDIKPLGDKGGKFLGLAQKGMRCYSASSNR